MIGVVELEVNGVEIGRSDDEEEGDESGECREVEPGEEGTKRGVIVIGGDELKVRVRLFPFVVIGIGIGEVVFVVEEGEGGYVDERERTSNGKLSIGKSSIRRSSSLLL